MNKRKLFAPFLTLLVAAITLGITLYWGYSLFKIVKILLFVIVVFYIIGCIVQNKVIKFIEENEEKEREEAEREGAVIEKENQDNIEDDDSEKFTLPPLTGQIPDTPGMANNTEEDSFGDFRTRSE